MSNAGFQAALAHLLASGNSRTALAERPATLAERFDLSAHELEMLVRTNPARLKLNASTVNAKRLDFLSRALPATCSVFAPDCHRHHPLLAAFTEACLPEHRAEQPNRLLAESERFLDFLGTTGTGVPAHVPDLARFELLRLQLVLSAEASESAQRAHRQPAAPDPAVRRQLGRHVTLARFGHDVLALYETFLASGAVPRVVEPWPTLVVLAKLAGGGVAIYRLGTQSYELLDRWRQPRTVAELGAAAPGPLGGVARFAVEEGLVLPDEALAG